MMQNLEVAFRDKERKLQEHISKVRVLNYVSKLQRSKINSSRVSFIKFQLKQGFPIPAAWETNMAKTVSRCHSDSICRYNTLQ